MSKERGYINLDLGGLAMAAILIGAVVGAVLCALSFWLLPSVWELLKPLIHGWTA